MPRRTNAEILEALDNNDGFITHAARELGIDASTIHRRMKKSKTLRQKYKEINRYHVEVSEKKLLEKIRGGDTACIIFHLKCKGGWREKQEVKHKHRGTIRVTLPADMEEV